jgi:hypothetical protein
MDGADAAAAGQQQQVPAIADSNVNNVTLGGSGGGVKKARMRKGKGRIEAGASVDADGSKRRCVSTACIGERDTGS